MKSLLLLIILIIICFAHPVSAVVYGEGGYDFEGNVSLDINGTIVQVTKYIEHEDAVPGYTTRYRFDVNSILDENTTTGDNAINHGAAYIENGRYGGAFEFNGTSDYMSTAYFPPQNEKTMIYWGNWSSTGDYDASGANDGSNHRFYLGTSYAEAYAGLGANSINTGVSGISLNTWYLWTLTVNATHGNIYRDTTFITSFAYAQSGISTLPITIAAINTTTGTVNYQNVRIDDFRVYNYNLTLAEITKIYNHEHKTSSVYTFPIQDATSNHQAYRFMVNGTFGDGIRTENVSMRHSTDNASWSSYYSIFTNISSETWYEYSVNKSQYYQTRFESDTTNTSMTPLIKTVIFENEATGVAPNITSYTPSTPNSTYKNAGQTFNIDIDQTVNTSWYIDSVLMQSNASITSASYFNDTALNGTYNVTAIVTNTNGTDFQTWNWTVLPNSFYMDITHFNRTNLSYNMIFETSNYTAGITQIDIEYPYTDNGNIYSLHYYANDTQIGSSQTTTATNQSLWFNNTVSDLPESTYYFKETEATTIETFVVPIAAFVAVVVAGAAVVSRRVRRGISGFWNRRIRRR